MYGQSMQLIAGRTAQEDNRRKNRQARSGRTGITLRLSKPMIICIGALCRSIWLVVIPGILPYHTARARSCASLSLLIALRLKRAHLSPTFGGHCCLYRIIRFLKIPSSRADALAKQEPSDLLSSTYPT